MDILRRTLQWRKCGRTGSIDTLIRYGISARRVGRSCRHLDGIGFRVRHEHREQFARLRLAGIVADAVVIARKLGEALAGLVDFYRSVVDLLRIAPSRTRGVDEGGFRMRMGGRRATRVIFDEHDFHALAGHVRQFAPAAAFAARRLRAGGLEEPQRRLVLKGVQLARSITTCAPAKASLRPSPVMVLTPVLGGGDDLRRSRATSASPQAAPERVASLRQQRKRPQA